jgi:hypothetical protein
MDEYLLLMSSALKAAYGLQNLLEGNVDRNIDSYSKEMLPWKYPLVLSMFSFPLSSCYLTTSPSSKNNTFFA